MSATNVHGVGHGPSGAKALLPTPRRQCERDHANGKKQKHVKCAPKEMRLNIWISLFFHGGVVLLG